MGYVMAALALTLTGVSVWLSVWISRLKDRIAECEKRATNAEARAQATAAENEQVTRQRDAALKAFDELTKAMAETPDDASSIADRLRRNFP
jgi:chromosome segregation ATPase